MHYEMPRLRFTALTRIVRILWSASDVKRAIARYFRESDDVVNSWGVIEEDLELKIENFQIPKELKIVLLSFVEPIGCRIKDIINEIYTDDHLPNHFWSILHWTLLGTIDVKKTVKAAIKDENLYLTKRYELACKCCLEDEISMLWNKLPERNKMYYFSEGRSIYAQPFLPIYWAYYMEVEINRLDRIIQDLFERSSTTHAFINASIIPNQTAVEYFFGKLSTEEKEMGIEYVFKSWEYTTHIADFFMREKYICGIIYFLISQMNEIQRASVLENHAYLILRHFMVFPYRGLYLEFESNLRQYLTEFQKWMLLNNARYREGFNYTLFRKLSED